MKKTIVLITNIFPYSPGEEFLETEIKYWAQASDVNFIIMPKEKSEHMRDIPTSMYVDNILHKDRKQDNKLKILYMILTSKIFYKELYIQKIFNLKKIRHTMSSVRNYLYFRGVLKKYIEGCTSKEIVFYSYWHTEVAYALQDLKKAYNHIKVVSRIHGYDLYQERRACDYMPLKQQFIDSIEKIYTISETATRYLISTYSFNHNLIEVARLGVDNKNIISECSDKNNFHIVSCSHMSKIKRIDKIIDALYIIALKNSDIMYEWTHIGDGEIFEILNMQVKEKFNNITNVKVTFTRHLNNSEVYRFYKNNAVDVFINVSESEGVPVTIMEAMSCHIPIIAPDIGGISDMLITNENGILLSSKCDVNEIVAAFEQYELFKTKNIRNSAYQIYNTWYNAKKNYNSFIRKVSGGKFIDNL